MAWLGNAFLGLILAAMAVGAGAQPADTGQMAVTGVGSVTLAPDMAMVEVGVSTSDSEASLALRRNSAAMQAIFAELEEAGIVSADIQTADVSLAPDWARDRRDSGAADIVGYTASNTVSVRVRDLASLGAVLDRLGAAGANRIHGIRFGAQDPAPALADARRAAVADAAAKAALYAEAAGVRLGPILRLAEEGGAPRPTAFDGMARMEAMAVPLAGGELTLSARVSVIYAIEP